MVRRMDRQGEVLIWCRKMLGICKTENGPKLMNCCKPEQVDTKEYGSLPRKQETERLEDKRGELPERSTGDCEISST